MIPLSQLLTNVSPESRDDRNSYGPPNHRIAQERRDRLPMADAISSLVIHILCLDRRSHRSANDRGPA